MIKIKINPIDALQFKWAFGNCYYAEINWIVW